MSLTKLTPAARKAGTEAVKSVYDEAYEKGGDPSIDSMRSENIEEAMRLAVTLSYAENTEQLIGIKKGIDATFAAILPESREQQLLVKKATSAYIEAACKELNQPVPNFGQERLN